MPTTPTSRVTQLSRSHRLDIDTATYPAVNYEQLFGIEDLKLIEDLTTEADDGYTDAGALRETNTGYGWRLEGKLAFSTNLAGNAINTVHTFLRTKFKGHRASRVERHEFGIRFYDRDGLDSGHDHEGRCYIKQWGLPGGKGRDVIDVVFQGQGPLADIANPVGSLVPTVTGLSPTGGTTAGGNLVNIYGQHFRPPNLAQVSAIVFGATAAPTFTVVSDSHIVVVAPARTAGVAGVRVTYGAGQSVDTSADDYTYA